MPGIYFVNTNIVPFLLISGIHKHALTKLLNGVIWLRSHLAAGGHIVGQAHRSMVVEEPAAFWKTWAGRSFDATGAYKINGALAPVSIELERGVGRYEEPNVWFAYAS